MTYPMAVACTDAAEVSLRGEASDRTGVAHVRVNGVDAVSADDFATWQVTLPLEVGDNELTITSEDHVGNSGERSGAGLLTRVPTAWRTPETAALDELGGRVLVGDTTLSLIFSVDGSTGERRLLSGPSLGTGPDFAQLRGIAYDPMAERLLALDDGLNCVLSVDGTSGDREILSDANTGSGPSLEAPERVAVDDTGMLAFVTDSALRAIVAIDLTTGDRAILSSDGVGAGQSFDRPTGVAYDPAGGRLLVTDTGSPARIWSVDPVNGDRTVVSDRRRSP